ncbi:thioredoxin reductase [Streptomyces corchorusii]|uniref:Thioredoxin reductase n=2 Tax=Streptomyces TaxID=1883 RepID=A0A124HK25_STRCK|nr:cyclic nucleotide-binding domain-containing thioredoxin-disulfide reductase [Streptomyces corchorusii]KUN18252.1 thioredoxin reductase [Streptomyces corchorusii]
MATSFPEIGDRPDDLATAAEVRLDDGQLARATRYATCEEVRAGDVLYQVEDDSVDLFLCGTATLEAIIPSSEGGDGHLFMTHGPGQFAGELNLLTGQRRGLTVRVATGGTVHRVRPAAFRRLMAQETELSDLLLRAILARRRLLRQATEQTLRIVGDSGSAAGLAMRTFLDRQGVPHRWLDSDSPQGADALRSSGLSEEDLPAALTSREATPRVTPGVLSQQLNLAYRRTGRGSADLTVVGAGPAGLAAAVYGASEGLQTVLLDGVAVGGQAATSARIENYLGFPFGLSGADLTARAAVQALKFGVHLASPCGVVGLSTEGPDHVVTLTDGTRVETRAVIIATGAEYRALPLDGWAELTGCGIYYAATDLEAQAVAGRPVAVVGGANSAGQAALHLARYASEVTLVVRGPDLGARMSAYLVERILNDPRITVLTGTEVTALHGRPHLDGVSLTTRAEGTGARRIACTGLFCFIGARPATTWLSGVVLDSDGFVPTDRQLPAGDLGPRWKELGREPLPYETSVPGVFAAGDVRLASMKRVAAAVGDGASAVRSVHQYLATI